LHNAALSVLERAGHTVAISNLQTQGFNPIASPQDFVTSSGVHADYVLEQRRAINTGTGFSPDIQSEMDKIKAADLVILNFPLRWSGPPAILQGWLQRVLAMGFAWDAEARYDKGLMRGKRALVSVAVGDPESYYSPEGIHRASVQQHIYSLLHSTLAFCGFDVHEPFILMNLTAETEEQKQADVITYSKLLETIENDTNFVFKHA
jgi:NAD(P)H dehydrogenase (quinone)